MKKYKAASDKYQYIFAERNCISFDGFDNEWALYPKPPSEECYKLNQAALNRLMELLPTHLTPTQWTTAQYLMQGKTQTEISILLGNVGTNSSVHKTIFGNQYRKGGGLIKRIPKIMKSDRPFNLLMKKVDELGEGGFMYGVCKAWFDHIKDYDKWLNCNITSYGLPEETQQIITQEIKEYIKTLFYKRYHSPKCPIGLIYKTRDLYLYNAEAAQQLWHDLCKQENEPKLYLVK